MPRSAILLLVCAFLLAAGCAKEEPLLTAHIQATCRDCIVSYAAGTGQSRTDTLAGIVDPATGDTIAEEGSWNLRLKDGDNIFFRACRIREDTAYGPIELSVSGGVRPMQASADTAQRCAEINGLAFAP